MKASDHGARVQLLAKLPDERAIGQLAGFEETAREIPGVLVGRAGAAGEENAPAPLDDGDGGRRRVVIEGPAALRAAPTLTALLACRLQPRSAGQAVTGARSHRKALT